VPDLSEIGGREWLRKTIPAVCIAVLVTEICLRFPLLALLYPVPVFLLFASRDKWTFLLNVLLAFVVDAIVSSMLSGRVSLMVAQSALFMLPLAILAVPARIRMRYRVAAISLIASIAWTFFFLKTGMGNELSALFKEASSEISTALSSMTQEGLDRQSAQAIVGADSIYSMAMRFLSCAVLPIVVTVYGVSLSIALGIASVARKTRALAFRPEFFFAGYPEFLALVCGMLGVVACRLFGASSADPIFWNVLTGAACFFALQGYGIVLFFLRAARYRYGQAAYALSLIALCAIAIFALVGFLAGLLIVGVLELFVPMRSRFINKKPSDPTPGPGRDLIE
jgi:hypothetical protein